MFFIELNKNALGYSLVDDGARRHEVKERTAADIIDDAAGENGFFKQYAVVENQRDGIVEAGFVRADADG